MDTNHSHRTYMESIMRIKAELGNRLLILTHHYQRKEIVDLGDHRGDSFALAQRGARDENARHIVFCGVHFMAESAAILAKENQSVQSPDLNAGCWMADMADAMLVERAWKEVTQIVGPDAVTPLVYMNSDAAIKAHCGRNNGAVCTSSNAPRAFEWAFGQRGKIFFSPDEHLGRNTAYRMGIPESDLLVWDPGKPLGGHDPTAIARARIILWKGFCLVHTRFTIEQINTMRNHYPKARIVVHPECTADVVQAADAVGSTSHIVKFTADAPSGSTIVIGTEINLIKRLALEYLDKNILPLHDSFCPNMYKINLKNLYQCLEQIGRKNVVTVDKEIRADAFIALGNMLKL